MTLGFSKSVGLVEMTKVGINEGSPQDTEATHSSIVAKATTNSASVRATIPEEIVKQMKLNGHKVMKVKKLV
jgi:hypothetical protein